MQNMGIESKAIYMDIETRLNIWALKAGQNDDAKYINIIIENEATHMGIENEAIHISIENEAIHMVIENEAINMGIQNEAIHIVYI